MKSPDYQWFEPQEEEPQGNYSDFFPWIGVRSGTELHVGRIFKEGGYPKEDLTEGNVISTGDASPLMKVKSVNVIKVDGKQVLLWDWIPVRNAFGKEVDYPVFQETVAQIYLQNTPYKFRMRYSADQASVERYKEIFRLILSTFRFD